MKGAVLLLGGCPLSGIAQRRESLRQEIRGQRREERRSEQEGAREEMPTGRGEAAAKRPKGEIVPSGMKELLRKQEIAN